jgi:GTP-binding protein HflX
MREVRVLKGHGTGNDFVLLPDLDGAIDLTDDMVQALCDRRLGIGGDGILRIVRSAAYDDPEATGAEFFMDYRNADGSLAQMCGNGIRVFARFLVEEGLADPQGVEIATRGGVRHVRRLASGEYAVGMGPATGMDAIASVMVGNRSYPATGVHVPNPHAVVFVTSVSAAGPLDRAPEVSPEHLFPDGVNVEFVEQIAPGHLRMRVHERGVGETLSCGTGACAVAWVVRQRGGDLPESIRIDVPGGTLHVQEREALRRVVGLSTELEDITEVEYRQIRLEQVVLVGVWTEGTAEQAERSLRELAALAETAGALVLDGVIQRRDRPDPATYIGSGKARELRDLVVSSGADTVICDGELSPGQLRHLEDVVKVKVVDRTWLILDIFAQHARSKAGRAQVSLAQMQYLLPRLRGWGESLSRQAGGRAGGATGGVGTRGPGETKIETDRRRIRDQMTVLRRQLKDMERVRRTQRTSRERAGTPAVALAGYTNAGKSSLLNRLTGAGVLVEDALFATLDPTVRKLDLPSGRHCTVADTVGFVRHLPHHLVEAFRSTLEEVTEADLVVHVVDGSDPHPEDQLSAVREVLGEIGAGNLPELVVINKADIADPLQLAALRRREPDALIVSAHSGEGIDELLARLDERLPRPEITVDVVVPYDRGDLVAAAHADGEVLSQEHLPEGTRLRARVRPDLAARLGVQVPTDADGPDPWDADRP